MRRLRHAISSAAAVTSLGAATAPSNAQLNLVLKKLGQQIVATDAKTTPGGKRVLTAVAATIDEKASALGDGNARRLVGAASIELKNAFWDAQASSLKAGVDLASDRKANRTDLKFTGVLRTDVVALANAQGVQRELGGSGHAANLRQVVEGLAASKAGKGVLAKSLAAALKANKDPGRFDFDLLAPVETPYGKGSLSKLEVHATPGEVRLSVVATGMHGMTHDLPLSREAMRIMADMAPDTAKGKVLTEQVAGSFYLYALALLVAPEK